NVMAIAALPDGMRALSGSEDETLRLWDLASGRELRRFDAVGFVWSLAILPDGKRALSGGRGGIQLWDLETGRELRRIEGHSGTVTTIALLPDGKRFLAADTDGSASGRSTRWRRTITSTPPPASPCLATAESARPAWVGASPMANSANTPPLMVNNSGWLTGSVRRGRTARNAKRFSGTLPGSPTIG